MFTNLFGKNSKPNTSGYSSLSDFENENKKGVYYNSKKAIHSTSANPGPIDVYGKNPIRYNYEHRKASASVKSRRKVKSRKSKSRRKVKSRKLKSRQKVKSRK